MIKSFSFLVFASKMPGQIALRWFLAFIHWFYLTERSFTKGEAALAQVGTPFSPTLMLSIFTRKTAEFANNSLQRYSRLFFFGICSKRPFQ